MKSLALLAAGAVQATSNSGIMKVVKLLEGMKQKVIEESAQAEKDHDEAHDLCIKTTTELKASIEAGQEDCDEEQALSEKGSAGAQSAAVEIATFGKELSKLSKEKSVAQDIRKEQKTEFRAKEKELDEAAQLLGKAYSVLKRHLTAASFIQGGDQTVMEVLGALSAVIDAAWVNPKGKHAVESLLEAQDGLSMKAPQAIVKAYESKSGGILQVIEQMESETSEALQKLRMDDMEKQHQHEMYMQHVTNQITNKEDGLAEAKERKGASETMASEAEAALAEASDALQSDKDDLQKTQRNCKKEERDYNERMKSATEEVSVIGQAVEILSSKFGAFIQISNSNKEIESRAKASELLRKLGRKFNSFGLIQAAASAEADPFAKVRGLIENMIKTLTQQMHDEATKEGKCKMDLANGAKKVKVASAQMKQYQSRLDKNQAEGQKLNAQNAELAATLKEMHANMQAATKIRADEAAANKATIEEAKESVEALNKAIQVLTEFYGKASLIQAGTGKQQDAADTIIGILQTAQSDFLKLDQETTQAEADAKDQFAEEKHDFEVSKTKKETLIKGNSKTMAALKVSANQLSEDITEATKSFEAASEFLAATKEACTSKAMSYEDKQRKRQEEIEGLNQALEILSPSEESFLQKKF